MRLLVDEDTQARTLVRLLREDGHDVLTAQEAGLNALADSEVLIEAMRTGRVLLTHNCADFRALHTREPVHPGILCVYRDREPARNLDHGDIVRCIKNVESSGMALEGEFIALNAWKRSAR